MLHEILEIVPFLGIVLGGAIFFTMLTIWLPTVAISFALFLYTGPTFGLIPRFDGRPVLVLVIIVLLLSGKTQPEISQLTKNKLNHVLRAIVILILAGLISLLWTQSVSQTISSLTALCLLLAALVFIPRRLTAKQLFNSVMLASSLIVIPSLLLGILGIPNTWRAGRLAGLLFNPNALSIYALILGVGATMVANRWLKWTLLIISFVTILLTASRGSGISILITLAFYFWFTYRSLFQRIFQISALGSFLYWIRNSTYVAEQAENPESIFRINNSRENFNEIAINDIMDSWPTGTGLGTASEAAVNILFKVLAELGPFGLAVLLIIIFLLLKSVIGNISGIAVVIAGVVGNVFEGWLISAGNTFTLLFFLLLVSTILKMEEQKIPSDLDSKSLTVENSP